MSLHLIAIGAIRLISDTGPQGNTNNGPPCMSHKILWQRWDTLELLQRGRMDDIDRDFLEEKIAETRERSNIMKPLNPMHERRASIRGS